MNRMAISAFASVFLLGGAGLAHAQQDPQQDRMVVRIGDLNLDSVSGASTAVNRVRKASTEFCGDADIRELKRTAAVLQCRREMDRKAVDKIAAPMVTAIYQQANPTVVLAAR